MSPRPVGPVAGQSEYIPSGSYWNGLKMGPITTSLFSRYNPINFIQEQFNERHAE